MCVWCLQMRAGIWTSWTISWSVCPSLPATTLCGHWPPSPMPVTSTTAPVSSPGMKIWTLGSIYLYNPCVICSSRFFSCTILRPNIPLTFLCRLWLHCHLCFSIEFDRDCDYFAIAGVTKKIKVFEYGTVIQDAVDIHYPVNEMTCNSKIRWGRWLLPTSNYILLNHLIQLKSCGTPFHHKYAHVGQYVMPTFYLTDRHIKNSLITSVAAVLAGAVTTRTF